MSLKFYEAIKTILSDIETFISDSLKNVNLPKNATNEKEELLKKLKILRSEFPQLNVEIREKTPEILKPSERAAQVDSQEIYDDIGGDETAETESTGPKYDAKPSTSTSDVSEAQLSAVELSNSAAMSGNLVRKNIGKSKVDLMSIFSSSFGKKYCLVSGGVFFFFDKLSSKKCSGSIELKGYEARASSEQSSKKEFSFELVCPGQKSYLFSSASLDEMDQWVDVLNKEALKIPDARLSRFITSSDANDEEEYEDPTPMVQTSTTQSKNVGAYARAPLKPPPQNDDDDDFYDDICHSASTAVKESPPKSKGNDDDGEIYDEAESKGEVAADEEAGDLLYEDYDDVQASSTSSTTLKNNQSTMVNGGGDNVSYEKMFYGKWDCKADSGDELAFRRGDIVMILSQEYDKFGWWVGQFKGTVGLVPREYLTPAYELVSG